MKDPLINLLRQSQILQVFFYNATFSFTVVTDLAKYAYGLLNLKPVDFSFFKMSYISALIRN